VSWSGAGNQAENTVYSRGNLLSTTNNNNNRQNDYERMFWRIRIRKWELTLELEGRRAYHTGLQLMDVVVPDKERKSIMVGS
jgi:hypothetical protein